MRAGIIVGRRSGRWLLMLLAATGIVTLAACSGSGDPASATEAAPAQQTSTPVPTAQALGQAAGGGGGGFAQLDETQVAALAACLVGRGFEIPEGASNLRALFGGGPPSAELLEALNDCGTEVGVALPDGFGGGGGAGGRGFRGGSAQLDETQVAALAACLVGRGFEIPDGATNLQTLFGGSPPSAELQEALNDCATEVGVALPSGFGGGGGGQ